VPDQLLARKDPDFRAPGLLKIHVYKGLCTGSASHVEVFLKHLASVTIFHCQAWI